MEVLQIQVHFTAESGLKERRGDVLELRKDVKEQPESVAHVVSQCLYYLHIAR